MRFSSVIPAMMVIAMACMGQSIQISGTVHDSVSGAVVKNATVRLIQNRLADTTDNAGNFSLVGMGTNLMIPGLGTNALSAPVFSSSGLIRFSLSREERVAVRAYSVQGKLLYSMQKTLQVGPHSIPPKQLPSGIYFYKVEIGDAAYTLTQIHIDGTTNYGGMAKSVHNAEGEQSSTALSKSLAALQDTILVTAAGYDVKRVPVTQTVLTGLAIKVVASTRLKVPMKAMCYGGTNWTDPAEIARRAKFDLICLQFWYGISASMIQTHVSAIRAINPDIKILAYMMLEGIGDNDALGQFLTTNNMWARNPWPNGTRPSVWSNTHGANLAGTRTVNGTTCIETLVNLYMQNSAYNYVDGVMFDNMWIKAAYDYDYNEDGNTESAASAGMRGAHVAAYQKAIARVKYYHPNFLIWCNPRAQGEKLTGYDDKAGWLGLHFDGYMNQNAGPGMSWNSEGVLAYDNDPTTLTSYRTYPAEATISGTPVHAAMIRNGWGGFARHSSLPTVNPSLGDIAYEEQTGGWVPNVQNVVQECKGFTETEEQTYGAAAQQHNRVCLGYWWVLTDIAPFIYGIDATGTGRSVVLTYQDYDWGYWIDSAGYDAGPYATVGGHPLYVRRADNGMMVLNPRYENGQCASQPSYLTINTPTPPDGKHWTTWSGGAVGSTINIPPRDCLFFKAVAN